MAVLLITYELKTVGKDYTTFFEQIKKNSDGWWHYLEGSWMSNTRMSAEGFAKSLFPYMTQSDYLLVIKVDKEFQGWLPNEAWDWLNQRTF
jgi:hypothetical protein